MEIGDWIIVDYSLKLPVNESNIMKPEFVNLQIRYFPTVSLVAFGVYRRKRILIMVTSCNM